MLTVTKMGRVVRAAHLLNAWRSCTPTVTASTRGYTPTRVEKNVVYCPTPLQGELPQEDIPSLIFSRAKSWSHKDAVECGVTGRKYTYGGMVDRALRWGAVVSQLFASQSSSSSSKTLAIVCTNAPEYPIILLGTLAVGANVTTVSTNYTAEEVARQLEDSGSEVIVTDPQLEQLVTAALARLKKNLPVFVNGASSLGHPNLRHIIEDTSRPLAEPVESALRSLAVVMYSSGTTGKPKGVQHSHESFTAALASMNHPDFHVHPTTDGVQDAVVGVIPFYHGYGLSFVSLSSFYRGVKVVSLPSFEPGDFLRIIKDHKVGVLHVVPPLLNFLVSSPLVTPEHLASVRSVVCTAAATPTSVAQAFKEKAPNPVIFQEGYGMTEIFLTLMTPVKEERLGSCGTCLPFVTAKCIDPETGETLAEGQRGELCFKTPTMMTGYRNNPTATAETIDADGWLHTGDVAMHQDGFFTIVDRIKELIKVKGLQVSPSELEDLLLQHPGVADVAVVGVEDGRAGELPRAYVVRQGSVTEEDLHRFMEPRVAEYKKLKGGITFVDSLPRTASGKLLRKDMKAMAAQDASL
ncbi:probable 4-coumarate--CoA ligase 3 [Panulirus ornatus]|uniref:probable 4-coumarate--CoA ligase 3 n=1 Tax=Panulirus ornatus TaxID=150431 RepID=UPI003A867DBE